MTKTKLTAGTWLVEIPESGLSVLCGCPENAYKLQKRAGLVRETEVGGWKGETGPNAILLSELPVQNGSFSNLIEFPVLQMLYRQGMMVPGHPNNTGLRPLLIGLREELASQAIYVHIGNYGLDSVEALVGAGLDEHRARELIRMKLRFAFGSIRGTDELLEFRTIDSLAVHLRGETFLRRLGLNRYQFIQGGESLEVDLNLGEGERYALPYLLPKRRVSRDYFSVVHLGEGDGWDRERPCMASLLMFRGEPWLIDAGPNIESSLEAVGLGVNDLRGVFLTHAHDDHFVGLTALLHAERRIALCAVPWVRASVSAKLEALAGLDEAAFGEIFELRDLVEGSWNNIEGLEVLPFLSPHPVETTCFRFRALGPEGWKSYAHLADLASFKVLDSMVEEDPGTPGISAAFATRAKSAYLEPADIKKVDIGGGMIHGSAADFRGDGSGLLYLSHTNMPLPEADKPIGSSAGFGDIDVLIAARVDYSTDLVVTQLRRYFPSLPRQELDVLLNCAHAEHNEGTILVKAGSAYPRVELLLSGVLERFDGAGRAVSALSSGSLVGALELLDRLPSATTVRSRTMVETLAIPNEVFGAFVARNSLEASLARFKEVGAFLRSCPLFSGMMSLATFADVAASAVLVRYEGGERLGGDQGGALHLIVEGEVALIAAGRPIETMGPLGVFGEESLLSSPGGVFEARSLGTTTAYLVPHARIRALPVALWKLRELHARRLVALRTTFDFAWKEAYSVGVTLLDEQHRRLFAYLDELSRELSAPGSCSGARPTISAIREYAVGHFAAEESLMDSHGFPSRESHAERHRAILGEIEAWETRLDCGEDASTGDFCLFLMDWLLRHTLSLDRQYIGRIG